MSVSRLLAVVCIYLITCAGWMILGVTADVRSSDSSSRLEETVQELWGTSVVQWAPSFTYKTAEDAPPRRMMPVGNDIKVDIHLDYRRKGLIWYPTYVYGFEGEYTLKNEEAAAREIRIHFDFPSRGATYDAFDLRVDGDKVRSFVDKTNGITESVSIDPGREKKVRVAYKSRGLGEWRYKAVGAVDRVLGLNLEMTTDFSDVDYPDGGLSPTTAEGTAGGKRMIWKAGDIITTQDIAVTIPERLNPGPLASRITWFAPVCLIFFFVLTSVIVIVRKVNVHPMHYLFVAAGFFAFHLLLVYLVDHLDVHQAFALSAVVSVGLVTGYLTAATGGRFPWKIAAAGQLFFLVLFSYSFFLKGMSGLTIAVGSVITLAVIMKVTIHVDWDALFGQRREPREKAAEIN